MGSREYMLPKHFYHIFTAEPSNEVLQKQKKKKKSEREKLKGDFKVSINVQSYQFESSLWPPERWNEFQPQPDPEQDKTAEGNKWINTFKELTFHSQVLQDVSYQFWQAC